MGKFSALVQGLMREERIEQFFGGTGYLAHETEDGEIWIVPDDWDEESRDQALYILSKAAYRVVMNMVVKNDSTATKAKIIEGVFPKLRIKEEDHS